jgi:CheY-specific phosphatase CheX
MQPHMMTPESLANQTSIALQVFLVMANMDIAPASAHTSTGEQVIASILRFSDPSKGTMLLECTPSLAYAFTARLMQVPTPESLDDDVRDAMGELANMIGGNLKGLMPEETCVSTPLVLGEADRQKLLQNNHPLSRVCMAGLDGHLCMILLESDPTALPDHAANDSSFYPEPQNA